MRLQPFRYRFGTTYRSHLRGSSLTLVDETDRLFRTSVTSYQSTTRNISEERGSQFTLRMKTVITHSTCSWRPKRALLRHNLPVPCLKNVHCYVTSCLFLASKTCIVTSHSVCSLPPKRTLLRHIPSVPYVQNVHCYVTSCLFLASKTCIVTSHPVCSLPPKRTLLRHIPSVPCLQNVHCYVTSCLFLSPKRALLHDILYVPYFKACIVTLYHQLTSNAVTIRHAPHPAPYPEPAAHKPLPPTTA